MGSYFSGPTSHPEPTSYEEVATHFAAQNHYTFEPWSRPRSYSSPSLVSTSLPIQKDNTN